SAQIYRCFSVRVLCRMLRSLYQPRGLGSFFFFNCSGDRRDLHSFPTRRSSDLSSWRPEALWLLGEAHLLAGHLGQAGALLAEARSEEHTSELQSLTNLVCRLLLEKKKKPAPTRALDDRPTIHVAHTHSPRNSNR